MEVDMSHPWLSHRFEATLITTLMMMNSSCQYNLFNLVTLTSATGIKSLGAKNLNNDHDIWVDLYEFSGL